MIYKIGSEPNFQSNAVILIRKPLKTVADGGFIKSISALLYTGGKIQNNGNAVIIFWVSYESGGRNRTTYKSTFPSTLRVGSTNFTRFFTRTSKSYKRY